MNSADFEVSLATVADLAEVRALAECCPDAPVWPEAAWQSLIRSHGAGLQRKLLLRLRDREGELCGWLAAGLVADSTELEFVLMAPAQRGLGLGRQLISAWLSWAAGEGATEALLEVRASNRAALKLYGGCGFQVQGRRPGYYRNPEEDAILMRLRL